MTMKKFIFGCVIDYDQFDRVKRSIETSLSILFAGEREREKDSLAMNNRQTDQSKFDRDINYSRKLLFFLIYS